MAVLKKFATNWAKVSEQTLLRGVLNRDQSAWREFLKRYDSTINKRMKYLLGRCWRMFRANDTVEDIKAEIYLALAKNDMGRLRAFNPERGTMKGWLSMITKQVTLNEVKRLARRPMPCPLEAFMDDEDRDHQRGAGWIADDWESRKHHPDDLEVITGQGGDDE